MTNDYRPISCDRHSEYEVLALRRAWVTARLVGRPDTVRVQVFDLLTRGGAEYLLVKTATGAADAWRLDEIVELRAESIS